MNRDYSFLDRALMGADRSLKTLMTGSAASRRKSPASELSETLRDAQARRHAAGLMRVNHCGEVCAQALYQGQALTARDPEVKRSMAHSAEEELDHLAWCEQRLRELDSQPSVLNPLFYASSFAIGAAAGAISDRLSLGFVAATEEQVCAHLRAHLDSLPGEDQKSRAIVSTMLDDEAAHASKAIEAGGRVFPKRVKEMMTRLSGLMTGTTYRL